MTWNLPLHGNRVQSTYIYVRWRTDGWRLHEDHGAVAWVRLRWWSAWTGGSTRARRLPARLTG